MAELTETTTIGEISVNATGHISIRTDTQVFRDGVPFGSPQYHRQTLAPGFDLAGQDARVVAVANSVWTDDVVAAHRARIAAQEAEIAAAQADGN